MPRPSIVGEYRALLESYLEAKMVAYTAQGKNERAPALPDHGGKVNVRWVTLDLGLAQTKEFFFFTKPELPGLISLIAAKQGLTEIGSTRHPDNDGSGTGDDDEAVKLLAELEFEKRRLKQRCVALEARLEHVQRTGMLRSALNRALGRTLSFKRRIKGHSFDLPSTGPELSGNAVLEA